MSKKKTDVPVLSQSLLVDGIYDMWIETDLADSARPGQFLGVYPANKVTLLPRPISICEVDRERHALRLVYRVVGSGTAEFALYQRGDYISVIGALGNGFPLEKAAGKRVCLMGGGIGIPPLLGLSKELIAQQGAGGLSQKLQMPEGATSTLNSKPAALTAPKSITSVLGYRDDDTFLSAEFDSFSGVVIATEDGSVGTKGNVIGAVKENGIEADVIFACGPMPMLRAIKAYAQEKGIKAYLSLEERMACGVGACLGCVCKTTVKDSHSHVNNARICTDGPVFDAEDLDI